MRWGGKAFISAMCGVAAHSILMFLKAWMGFLPSFEPYHALQDVMIYYIGAQAHPIFALAVSYLSGATIIGFLFARIYPVLPGKSGAVKGVAFGILGWAMMGMLFFPLIGLGFFAFKIGQGSAPALFSFVMLLIYSIVMGLVYAALNSQPLIIAPRTRGPSY